MLVFPTLSLPIKSFGNRHPRRFAATPDGIRGAAHFVPGSGVDFSLDGQRKKAPNRSPTPSRGLGFGKGEAPKRAPSPPAFLRDRRGGRNARALGLPHIRANEYVSNKETARNTAPPRCLFERQRRPQSATAPPVGPRR